MSSPKIIQNPLIPSTLSGSLNTTTPTNAFQIDTRGFQSSAANFSLTGLSGDADLRVFREPASAGGARVQVGESKNQGKLSESVLIGTNDLTPGIYTIEVTLGTNTPIANYNLNVAVNADANLSNILWRNAPAAQVASWKMDGVALTSGALDSGIPASWQVQGVADLNGDGEDDLLWRDANSGSVAYWLFKGGERVSSGYVCDLSIPKEWQISTVKDLDGDGQADIVWNNASAGLVAVWTLRDGKLANGSLMNTGVGWKPVAAPDLNGDTKGDIVLQNSVTGEIALWQMDGAKVTAGAVVKTGASWEPQFFGDFNGDGKTDILLRDRTSGALAFWLMNGVKIDFGWATDPIPAEWQIESIGNFDGKPNVGNGNDDLLWRNRRTGEVVIWQLKSDGRSLLNAQAIKLNGQTYNNGANWTIAGVGDFNRDGKEDILYRSEQQSSLEVLLMDGLNVVSKATLPSVPGDWKVQGIMQRQVYAESFEISGRSSTGDFSAATAFDLGLMDGSATYKDRVDPGMPDYFKFNVSTESNVSLSVAEPGANLELFKLQNGTLGSAIAISDGMLLSSGDYVIKVSAKSNNAFSLYTLSAVGKPKTTDVAGAEFSLAVPSLALNPSPTNPENETGTNQKNVVSASFKVKNNSSTSISKLEVGFRLSRNGSIEMTSVDPTLKLDGTDSDVYTLATPLAPGQTSDLITVQLRLPDTAESFWYVDGTYTVGMVVDPNNKLSEANELNNFNVGLGTDKAALNITKTETLDLIGSNMQISGDVGPGKTINVSFTVSNIGNRAFPDATQLPIEFYLSPDPSIDPTVDAALTILTVDNQPLNSSLYYLRPPDSSSTILGAAKSGSSSKTIQFQLKLPSTTDWNWGTGMRTFYITSWLAQELTIPGEANVSNNKIDPATVGTPDDTLNKNYVKFTLS